MPFCCICNNLFYLFLCIKTTISFVTRAERGSQNFVLAPPGTELGELGVFFHLNPPAIVVGEVPVELVYLVMGQPVDEVLDSSCIKEGTGNIEVHAPVTKTRGILYLDPLNCPVFISFWVSRIDNRREHLEKGLDSVKNSGFR